MRAYDLDRNGILDKDSEGRVIVDKISGVPGGIRVDEKGNLWVAADGVLSYSPQGKLLGKIAIARDTVESDVRRRRLRDAVHYRAHVGVSRAGRREGRLAKLAKREVRI